MTNKRKYAVPAAVLAALMLGTAACKQEEKRASSSETTTTTAAVTTTEAETTTTAAPETTTTTSAPEVTTSEETPADEEFAIKTGVWLSQSEYEGESYYTFLEDGSGNVLSQDMGIGVPYSYTHEGTEYTFEMAAVDNFVKMNVTEASEDRIVIKWEYGLEETLTYLGPADGFRFFSTDVLCNMAAYRFMQDNNGYAMFSKYGEIQPDGLIKITLNDCSNENKGVIGCYTVDRYTGKGTDINGSEVELAELGEDVYQPFFWQKTAMSISGSMLGVRYIGYVAPESNDARIEDVYFNNLFYRTGISAECNFNWDAETTRFFSTKDGHEFYLVIPYDSNASVIVKEMKFDDATATLVEGDDLYHIDNDGTPFLLKCNVSEIMPDVKVIVTDSQGNTLEWMPGISGENGSVLTNATGGTVHDLTNYLTLATPDMAPVG